MVVSDLKKGDRAVILRVELSDAVKERLRVLDIRPGAEIVVFRISPFRATYLLGAGHSKVAIRREISKKVQVFRR